MPRKSLLERLDDSVRWTGIPAVAAGNPRRRPLRWPSTLALLLAIGGLLVSVGVPDRRWFGYASLMLGFGLANFMPIFGPLKPWGSVERVDERDRALRARAFLAAFSAISAVAVIGLWAIAALATIRNWNVDTLRWAIINLAFLLAVIFAAGPTCYASWAERRVEDDD